jgi:hypothetical protein
MQQMNRDTYMVNYMASWNIEIALHMQIVMEISQLVTLRIIIVTHQ